MPTNLWSRGSGSVCSYRKTTTFTRTSPIVTTGTVRDGMTSLIGIIGIEYIESRKRPLQARRYNQIVAPSRPRLGALLRWVIAAYFVALAAMPFAHHDLVCHLKSSTHCSTCHVGASADPGGSRPTVASADLADAGATVQCTSRIAVACALSSSAGRAPPVTTASHL